MLLQGTDCLHQRTFKISADAHNLARRLHLRRQRPLCRNKFIKRKSRKLDNTIIQCRLKACIRFSRNGIFDFIQRIAQRDLCCNLGYRIAGRLTCQCRRTADTGIYLDDTVFKAGRMQGKLYITAACNLKCADNI